MSSINGGVGQGSFQQGGIQMGGTGGQMPDGSGSFYMGDDGQQQQEQQQQNPELVLVDQGEVDRRSQNRQFLENIITGREKTWFNPWSVNPEDNLRVRGREVIVQNANQQKRNRQFLVNA